jgi:hypothetical protein
MQGPSQRPRPGIVNRTDMLVRLRTIIIKHDEYDNRKATLIREIKNLYDLIRSESI